MNEWLTLQSRVPDISKIFTFIAGTWDPLQGFMPAWEKVEMQKEGGRRKCGMLFASLIVLWHQYLIFSLRIFPIVSAELRKLLIAEKGHTYASVGEEQSDPVHWYSWCPPLRADSSPDVYYPLSHPSSPRPCRTGSRNSPCPALNEEPAVHIFLCALGQVTFLRWAHFLFICKIRKLILYYMVILRIK